MNILTKDFKLKLSLSRTALFEQYGGCSRHKKLKYNPISQSVGSMGPDWRHLAITVEYSPISQDAFIKLSQHSEMINNLFRPIRSHWCSGSVTADLHLSSSTKPQGPPPPPQAKLCPVHLSLTALYWLLAIYLTHYTNNTDISAVANTLRQPTSRLHLLA